MDRYWALCVVIISLSVMEVNTVYGFSVRRNNDTAKQGDVNVTCVTKLTVANDSGSKQDNVPRPENASTIMADVLYQTKENEGELNKTKVAKDKKENPLIPRQKELPMAMIIAGPAAAVGIALFLCVSYYWHTRQLDSKARELSVSLYVSPDESTDSNDSCKVPLNTNASRSPRAMPPPPLPTVPSFAQRRKSTLSVPNLGIPGNMHKRGSSWSAIADQEILNLSAPRRHSTFIL